MACSSLPLHCCTAEATLVSLTGHSMYDDKEMVEAMLPDQASDFSLGTVVKTCLTQMQYATEITSHDARDTRLPPVLVRGAWYNRIRLCYLACQT